MITAVRSHTISAAHRLVDHPGACARVHGHTYTIDIEVAGTGGLDPAGMVLDFGMIKTKLCAWLDTHWDHRLILWEKDPLLADQGMAWLEAVAPGSLWIAPFNPTAEQMAAYLARTIFPDVLRQAGLADTVRIASVTVHETEKCAARAIGCSWGG